jgi:hypothetical protein
LRKARRRCGVAGMKVFPTLADEFPFCALVHGMGCRGGFN